MPAPGRVSRHLPIPTADEVILSMKAYFHRLDEAAALMYEVPDARFGVVENDGLLELAVPDPRGDYTGLIVDVLALDVTDAQMMMSDIERTCGFVKAKFRTPWESWRCPKAITRAG